MPHKSDNLRLARIDKSLCNTNQSSFLEIVCRIFHQPVTLHARVIHETRWEIWPHVFHIWCIAVMPVLNTVLNLNRTYFVRGMNRGTTWLSERRFHACQNLRSEVRAKIWRKEKEEEQTLDIIIEIEFFRRSNTSGSSWANLCTRELFSTRRRKWNFQSSDKLVEK